MRSGVIILLAVALVGSWFYHWRETTRHLDQHASREQTVRELNARLDRREGELAAVLARLRQAEARIAELAPPPRPASPDAPSTGSVLLARNLGSQVTFTYGTPAEAGRYVGQTLRRLFEATRSPDPAESDRRLREVELDLLSMGPFIKDAEQIESDPTIFAEFQSATLGEVFAWDEARRAQARELLRRAKTQVTGTEPGSPAWDEANTQATRQLLELLTPEEESTRQSEIDFVSSYSVLLVPTYSILTK